MRTSAPLLKFALMKMYAFLQRQRATSSPLDNAVRITNSDSPSTSRKIDPPSTATWYDSETVARGRNGSISSDSQQEDLVNDFHENAWRKVFLSQIRTVTRLLNDASALQLQFDAIPRKNTQKSLAMAIRHLQLNRYKCVL